MALQWALTVMSPSEVGDGGGSDVPPGDGHRSQTQ